MSKNVIIVIVMILSVMMIFGGMNFFRKSGTFFTKCIPYLADIVIHAPNGSEYDWGQVASELGHDIGFAFLFEAPQIVKTIINFISGSGTLEQRVCVSTVDKEIYFIQELVLCIQDPDHGRFWDQVAPPIHGGG